MKNSTLVTAYLDHCDQSRLDWDSIQNDPEALIAAVERLPTDHGESQRLFEACLDDGWTVAELDAAYARHFGSSIEEMVQIRSKI